LISDDTPYRLAYDASTRALDDQARALESLRTRAGTMFAATALVTSFLGGIALTDIRDIRGSAAIHWHAWSFSAAAVAAFVALLILTMAILLPYRLRFSLAATEIVEILEGREEAGGYPVPRLGGGCMDDRTLERTGVRMAELAPKPTPRWPDVSKPDTRGGGGGDQKNGDQKK